MIDDLRIRSAVEGDARLLFEWRNDEETRAMSGDTAPLAWESHLEWFSKVLSGGFPGRYIYIVETEDRVSVGTVRSDELDDGCTEVSYTVAPQWRGRGLGKRMVLQFAREKLSGKKLLARIEKGHVPSERIAEALGLKPASEEEKNGRLFQTWT